MAYPRTDRTTATRDRGRVNYDRAVAHAILDEAYYCHMAFTVDGEPRMLPMLHVRIDDTVYVHGSTGGRPLLDARGGGGGLPICLTVTHLDGLVLARSQFHHSANYRSVVAHGTARLVTGEDEKLRVLTALIEKVAPGRSAQTRPPSRRELAETALLALPLREVSVKARAGGVIEEPEDLTLPYWAGVVPLRLTPGIPEPDTGVTAPTPSSLRPHRSPWLDPAPMSGSLVALEPLDVSHVDGLFVALADEDVWRFLSIPQPAGRDEMASIVAATLVAAAGGRRVAWVQRSVVTGEIVGTTSYWALDEPNQTVEIGGTMLGKPWWRSGINTEAKLLLLTRAFEELGATRVEWHTDVRNARSQAAIARLGATREGIRRHHVRRPDGSWRDSVLYSMVAPEWPAARSRLESRLTATTEVR